MVLAHAEAVDADFLGEHSLVYDVAQRLRLRDELVVAVDDNIAERVETHFQHVQVDFTR